MTHITVQVQLIATGNLTAIPVSFDPKKVLGKIRAPVLVTINGYSYSSTIASMGGETFIPLRKSHRETANVNAQDTYSVHIELDTQKRIIIPPKELDEILKEDNLLSDKWLQLSYTMQKEYAQSITNAKKQETKTRRLQKAVNEISARIIKK